MNPTLRAAHNLAVHIASLRDKHPTVYAPNPIIEFTDQEEMHQAILATASVVDLVGFTGYRDYTTLQFNHTTLHGHTYLCYLSFRFLHGSHTATT